MKADITTYEEKRLEVLRQSGLLDTPPEQEFDQLVRLASLICDTPIALVSLIDEDRQWFKANIGLDINETPRDQAFCHYTIQQPEIMVVPDATRDPRFVDNPLVTGEPNIRFYAGVPLEADDGFRLGSLCVIDRVSRQLSWREREALTLLSQQARKLINLRRQQQLLANAVGLGEQISNELQKNRALFHAFMDNSPFLSYLKTPDGMLAYYNQRFADHFGIDRKAGIGKPDSNLWPPEVGAAMRANDRKVLAEWTPLTTEECDAAADGEGVWWRTYRFPFRDTGGRQYVAGSVVDITADKRAERHLQSYQQALEEANEQLRALATTDGLTGVRNRRAFDHALSHEYELSRRYGHPLALLILDIDNFKALNDDFGHDEGDRVLKAVAEGLSGSFRAPDTVARYGGEEFAIILPHTSAQPALHTADRTCRMLAACAGDRRCVTVSIGVAALLPGWTPHDLVRRADEALYSAKRTGKNRACLATPEDATAA